MPERPYTPTGSMTRLFEPRGIAIVGASPTNRWGLTGITNLVTMGFKGDIAAVNPRYDEVLGFPCAPSISELPFVPDAVMVNVKGELVEAVVQDAVAAGVGGAVVVAIGFADAGDVGRERQRRIVDLAREGGLAIVGPNCQGLVNFTHRSPLYMVPVFEYEPGSVALMSHSGSVTTALTNNNRGVRWSHVVSCGNEAIVDVADLLAYFLDQESVKVVAGYLETIRDSRRFFEQCDRARELGKPVVVLKSGRTEAAQRAATAHTGALSAPDRLIDSLLRRHGVVRVDSMEELLQSLVALQSPTRPKGGRIATITASGGHIELVLDEVAHTSLTHPDFSERTQARLRTMLPDFLGTSNPLDYWGMDDFAERFPELVGTVADDESVDTVIMIGDFSSHPTRGQTESREFKAATELAKTRDELFVVLDTVDGAIPTEEVERAIPTGSLVLSGLREGLRAVEHVSEYWATRPRVAELLAVPEQVGAMVAGFDSPISGHAALMLLAALGVRTPKTEVVNGVEQAVASAERIGFPVVLKTGDPRALHKTEAGGVHLGLSGAEAVRLAAASVALLGDGSILVQEQIEGGIELLIGVQTDPELGTFLLVGMGGIWTEILDDVSIRPVGLLHGEADKMVRSLRSFPLMEGVRGAAPCDLSSVLDVIGRVDALASSLGSHIESIDVNPLIVTPSGAIAVDCLVVPRAR